MSQIIDLQAVTIPEICFAILKQTKTLALNIHPCLQSNFGKGETAEFEDIRETGQGKGSPTEKVAGSIRALPKWGRGGLEPCLNGLGHLFREELSMFKWAFPCFGGSEPLPGWFGALMQ